MKLNPNTYTTETAIKDMLDQGYTPEAAKNHPVLESRFNERGRRIIEGVRPPKRPETAIEVGRTSLAVMERAAGYVSSQSPDRAAAIPIINSRNEVVFPNERESVLANRKD